MLATYNSPRESPPSVVPKFCFSNRKIIVGRAPRGHTPSRITRPLYLFRFAECGRNLLYPPPTMSMAHRLRRFDLGNKTIEGVFDSSVLGGLGEKVTTKSNRAAVSPNRVSPAVGRSKQSLGFVFAWSKTWSTSKTPQACHKSCSAATNSCPGYQTYAKLMASAERTASIRRSRCRCWRSFLFRSRGYAVHH